MPDKPIVSDTVELSACPFCGTTHDSERLKVVGIAGEHHAHCETCWASGPMLMPGDKDAQTEAIAAERWNHRADATIGKYLGLEMNPHSIAVMRDVLRRALASNPPEAPTVEDVTDDIGWQIANECWMSTTEKAKLARRIRAALSAVEADKQKVREGEWIELSSESYPVAETVVVSYFDQDVGEWVLAIKDAPIETSPWTHFLRTGRPTAGERG